MKVSRMSLLYIVFFLALFIPTRFFDIYHIFLIGSLLLLAVVYKFDIINDTGLIFFLMFLFLIVVSIFVGSLYYQSDPIRNFTEIVRFFPLLILILSLRKIDPSYVIRCVSLVFFVYSFLCLIVSFFQVNLISFIDPVTNIYGSTHQVEFSLGISSRALGLSSGPGQNGAIMAIVFSFSLGQLLIGRNKLLSVSTAFLSFVTIILSQSQTAFIVSLGVASYSLLFSIFFLDKKYKSKAIKYVFLFLPVGFFSLIYFKNSLNYLFTLFSHGLERSSYQARLRKTEYLYNMITDNVYSLIFGHGKDYFGPVSGHMDNEYMFYLGVYGLFSTIFIICLYVFLLSRPYFLKKEFILNSNFNFSLHLIIVAGVVLAWPSSFILDPRVFFIVSFLYVMSKRESRFNKV